MSKQFGDTEVITAYANAVPEKQQQSLPGLDKKLKPHIEYTKLELWDDDGKPYLEEYTGSGKLKGKTAIVTGGDSGLGRSAAIMFAREGATGITIAYLPEEQADAEDSKKMIEDSGAKCNLFASNLMDNTACHALIDSHIKAFGKLNILVNNASKQIFCKKFEEIDLNNVESTFQSNIIQMMAVTKFALPHLKRGASIINTTSVTAYRGSPGLVDYSSTKGAITSFTRSLALQVADRGIKVNGIAPGLFLTSLQAASRPADEMEGLGAGGSLRGRGGQPAELGPSFVFLASSDSNYMTGAILHINAMAAPRLLKHSTPILTSRLVSRCFIHTSSRRMSAENIVTAYSGIAVPHKQEQNLPGLDKHVKPGMEYSKIEVWNNGKPSLMEYKGSGKLQGKTAIITGGDSGIGRAAAIMFAREGCTGITITYLSQEEPDAEDAKRLIQESGAKCQIVCADLMNENACKALVDNHVSAFGQLDVLVNNASKQIMCKNFEEIDLKNVESTFRSNILQMFAVTKFSIPHLKRGSSIINTTSVTAYKGSPALVDYSSTKGAIVSFTRALAQQLAPKGIRVNGIAPGPVITALQPASRPAEQMEGLGVGLPLHGRAGQPAELGPAYVFLASSDANLMTGQVLHINCGQHIGGS
ncbi:hypothetical protein CVT24_007471 [Panaeolus cyanescens]|uniref:Uncharacterized protein n=1 Tax=Panaeolus cyanescens TaxID=181874 RepID=A0A409YL57_9AGAR|nr:hypothetical protein CVT24_007471 [Panaeolus cyanescens]